MPIATEIRLRKAEHVLEVAFDDGARFSLPTEYLRVESSKRRGAGPRSGAEADCRRAPACWHHGDRAGGELRGAPGVRRPARHRDLFVEYLHQLGREQARRWAEYLDELAARGMTRE